MNVIKTSTKAFLALTSLAFTHSATAADTVKVGVLHSLSGTMAISETSLRDILLYTFDEINAKGGVMGKKNRTRRRRWRFQLAALRRKSQAAP